MPEKKTMRRVARDRAEGKAPSTQAGEFVREEIEHIREGKHGARSTKQAIAIGLSKARRAGVKLPAQKTAGGAPKKAAKRPARKESAATHRRRSRAAEKALQREGSAAASPLALTRQTNQAARKRTPAERSRAAQKAVKTKGPVARKKAARKAARTRAAHQS